MSASPRSFWPLRRLLVLVALAVLVQGALAVVLVCHAAAAQNPAVARDTTATVPAVAGGDDADCPGCPAEDTDTRQDGSLRDVGAADQVGTAIVDAAECTAHRPCQHRATDTALAAEPALRAPDPPRDSGPAARPSCREAVAPTLTSSSPPTTANRVPAAVAAPVAVLCVDRN